MSYLRVCQDIDVTPIELPTEEDDTLPVSTLQAQFPCAVGLKYLPDSNTSIFRGIRCLNGLLKPPNEGWEGLTLYCVYPPDYKRKLQDETGPNEKKNRHEKVKCADLIVLGLNFSTTSESLKQYFEKNFGPLLMSLVKVDLNTNRSKGFGFIRFQNYEDQVKAITARRHEIDGRWATIKPPFTKDGTAESALPSKVFISRLNQSTTKDDLESYFAKYGEIADTYMPQPFRGFAFLTFVSPDSANEACDEEPHILNGVSVAVVHATDPLRKKAPYKNYSDNGRGGYSGRGGYDGYSSSYRGGGRGGGGGFGPSYSNGGSTHNDSSRYNPYPQRGRGGDYDGPSSRGGGGGGGGGGRHGSGDLGSLLAAALKNTSTLSTLLNNLEGSSSSSDAMSKHDRDYNAPPEEGYGNKFNMRY